MSWDVAVALLDMVELADLVGERHRIIANDWQAAPMSTLAGRLLARAAGVLDHVDFWRTFRARVEQLVGDDQDQTEGRGLAQPDA